MFRTLMLSLVFLAGVTPVFSQSAVDVAKTAFESTVLLVMEDSSGQPLQIGSGFLIRPGEIATNMHVIEGASSGYAKFIGKKKKYDLLGIIASDEDRDLVILKISSDISPSLSIGDSEALEIGETVFAVGNPKGLEGTFSQGIISGVRTVGSDTVLQITAPISPGSSGGPVLNESSKVVGISVATFQGGQNLNFAIPANYLQELMGKTGEPKKFSPGTVKSKKGLTSGFGGPGIEGVMGTRFLWDEPFQLSSNSYSFSLKNNLRENVSDLLCLVIFYDEGGEPIDVDTVEFKGIVPARLAKRVESYVDGSVFTLTTKNRSQTPTTAVEIRILRFKIEE